MKNDATIKALARAAAYLGGVSILAATIGVRQSTISNWRKRGTTPSPAYCLAIERATNGAVMRSDLRPHDFWQIWPDLARQPQRGRRKRTPSAALPQKPAPAPQQTPLAFPEASVMGALSTSGGGA